MCNIVWHKRKQLLLLWDFRACIVCILYGWWCRSFFKILLSVWLLLPSWMLCRLADFLWILTKASYVCSMALEYSLSLLYSLGFFVMLAVASKFVTQRLIAWQYGKGTLRVKLNSQRNAQWAITQLYEFFYCKSSLRTGSAINEHFQWIFPLV